MIKPPWLWKFCLASFLPTKLISVHFKIHANSACLCLQANLVIQTYSNYHCPTVVECTYVQSREGLSWPFDTAFLYHNVTGASLGRIKLGAVKRMQRVRQSHFPIPKAHMGHPLAERSIKQKNVTTGTKKQQRSGRTTDLAAQDSQGLAVILNIP